MFHSEPKLWSKFTETKSSRKTRFSSRTPNLIPCKRNFALTRSFHVHCGEVANGSLIVCALSYWSVKSKTFHSWGEPLQPIKLVYTSMEYYNSLSFKCMYNSSQPDDTYGMISWYFIIHRLYSWFMWFLFYTIDNITERKWCSILHNGNQGSIRARGA